MFIFSNRQVIYTLILAGSLQPRFFGTSCPCYSSPINFFSVCQDTAEHKNLPLFASGGAKFFWDTKFDMAMVAFLDCLQQFKEELGKGDTEFHLPYNMDSKGKIEDETTGNTYSVK